MQHTTRRLAQSVSSLPLSNAAAQLLPPLMLYRRLLTAHKKLPFEMRVMGDGYVKAEFRRHAAIDNPLHIIGFLGTWKQYLDQIEKDQGIESIGKRLEEQTLEKLSPEQVAQLYELMQATRKVYDPDAQGQELLDGLEGAPRDGTGSQGGSTKD